MKRNFVILGMILAVLGLVLAALPLLVSSDNVRSRILTQLHDLTGQTVTFRGKPAVSLRPFLGIKISDLVISDAQGGLNDLPLLSVEHMQGRLNILPALLGNIVIDEFRLVRPKLNLKVTGDGAANWIFDSGQLHEAMEGANQGDEGETATSSSPVDFGVFEIVDGAIEYENQITGQIESITSIAGTFAWPSTAKAFEFSGNGIWRGERVEANTQIKRPLTLFAGGESDLAAEYNSTPLQFVFDGSANMLSSLQVAGKLSAASPSLGRLSEFLKLDIGYFGGLGELKLAGELNAIVNEMTLSSATISIGQNTAKGLVHFSIGEVGNPKLDGTLAFGDIDVSAYFEDTAESGPITVSDLVSNIQLDLRVSANSLIAGKVTLEDLAAAITMRNKEWIFDIGDSRAFGGSVIARLGERNENEARYRFLELSARGVDATKIAELLPQGFVSITGLADIDASLRSDGETGSMLVRQLKGEVSTKFTDGQIRGMDIVSLLHSQTSDGNTAQPLDVGGSTGFEQMSAKMFINRGIAWISKGMIDTGKNILQIHGNADLYAGSLALRTQEIIDTIPGRERLFIGGSFHAPLVTLETGPANEQSQQDSTTTQGSEISN